MWPCRQSCSSPAACSLTQHRVSTKQSSAPALLFCATWASSAMWVRHRFVVSVKDAKPGDRVFVVGSPLDKEWRAVRILFELLRLVQCTFFSFSEDFYTSLWRCVCVTSQVHVSPFATLQVAPDCPTGAKKPRENNHTP